jgi:Fe-S-cluster containining protein
MQGRTTDGDTIGFHCTACGKCCNSAPAMSMPELLRHRGRFIGSLAVGRVRSGAAAATEAAAELAALQDAIFHRDGDRPGAGHVSLVTQAFDYPSLARCPALGADGGCGVHGPDKPAMCRVVPLDPYLSDSLQAGVLLERRASGPYLDARAGTSCIAAPGPDALAAPYRPLVMARRVAAPDYAADLARRRADLVDDKARWGNAVFRMLRGELARTPAAHAGGYRVLPLVPVLAVLAAESPTMRAECVDYIDAQLALIETEVGAALARRRPEDRTATAELRGFAAAYARQRPLLANWA